MAHQTADDGHHRHLGIFTQAQRHLKVCLALGLAFHLLGSIHCGDGIVNCGVISGHVDAVQDAVELIGHSGDDGLQAVGVSAVMELHGIGGADGGNGIGHQHGGLHQIDVAIHGQRAVVPPALMETEQVIEGLGTVTALILHIVDGKYGLNVAHGIPAGGHILQIHGDECRLPVVAVDHIGHAVEAGQQVHHGLGEEGEALAVVIVAVKAAAAEIVLVIHKVPRYTAIFHGEQTAVLMTPCHIHIDVAAIGHLLPPLLRDLTVEGQDDRDVVAALGQGDGQAARHVCKTAGLTEGERLGGCK